MSDKSAVEVIAGVLESHLLRYNIGHECTCGGWLDTGPGYRRVVHNWQEHLAAEIDKALGGLSRELRINSMSSAGCTTDTKTGETTWHSDIRRDARWVGGWTPMERGTEAPD